MDSDRYTFGHKRTYKLRPFAQTITIVVSGLSSPEVARDKLETIAVKFWGWKPRRYWELWRPFDSDQMTSLYERDKEPADGQ